MTKCMDETWSDEKLIPMVQNGVSRTQATQHHLDYTLEQECAFYTPTSGAARNYGQPSAGDAAVPFLERKLEGRDLY